MIDMKQVAEAVNRSTEYNVYAKVIEFEKDEPALKVKYSIRSRDIVSRVFTRGLLEASVIRPVDLVQLWLMDEYNKYVASQGFDIL